MILFNIKVLQHLFLPVIHCFSHFIKSLELKLQWVIPFIIVTFFSAFSFYDQFLDPYHFLLFTPTHFSSLASSRNDMKVHRTGMKSHFYNFFSTLKLLLIFASLLTWIKVLIVIHHQKLSREGTEACQSSNNFIMIPDMITDMITDMSSIRLTDWLQLNTQH